MSAKSEQKQRTHEIILESAAKLLRSKGIAGARVADVMKGAGLTVGGFYAHFASKEALVDDTLRLTAGRMRTRLFGGGAERGDAKNGGPPLRAETILARYLSAAHRDQPDGGCPFPAVIGEVATSAHEHRGAVAEQVGSFASELEALLPAGARTPRRHVALALFALMYGGLSLARALQGTELSDEMLKACRALGRAALRDAASAKRHADGGDSDDSDSDIDTHADDESTP
jgi:TetR/AcrR family transcriptional repressor of nem operon